MNLRRSAAVPDSPDTRRMIDAAMNNESELPLRGSLQPSTRRKVSMFVSTALGKVVLCSTVAAASVSGVALTTDRITLDTPPVTIAPSAIPPDPSTTDAPPTTTTEPATATIIEPDTPVATDEPPTEAGGCEFGQATADGASEGHSRPDDHPLADHDPCDRSGTLTPGEPPARNADAESNPDPGKNRNGGDTGNAGGNRTGNPQGNVKPG
jgi:hypothetical protein